MAVEGPDTHAHVQRLVTVVKMATMLEEYITKEQRTVVLFFSARKDSVQRIFIKKCFLFMLGSVCRVKRQRFADDEEVETEVRKWLRQQPKGFYTASFDALVKRWDKCISVGGGYVEK
jgi:hypothetical protein